MKFLEVASKWMGGQNLEYNDENILTFMDPTLD